MDTPKPSQTPASGISLHPPRPAGVPAPQGRAPAPRKPAPKTVKVVHEKNAKPKKESRDLPRPGGFRIFLGFLFALLGGLAVAYYPDSFVNLTKPMLERYYQYEAMGTQGLSASLTPEAITKANALKNEYEHLYRWTPQVVGVLCLLIAGWCLKKRIGYFLAGSAAFAVTIAALTAAFDWSLPSHCMAMPAVGLGYLIQTGQKRADITIRGTLGFGFVVVALAGLVLGIFYLPRWGGTAQEVTNTIAKDGPAYLWSEPASVTPVYMLSAAFVEQWKDVVLWGGVLLVGSIGAVLCRDKLLRFLSACLFTALAVLLFKAAHVNWMYFPTLGENIPPQPHWSYGNIEIWQWLVLAELVVVAAVLIYKALGAGGLTVTIALVWLCSGLHVDTYAGRLIAARQLSPAAAQSISVVPMPDTSGKIDEKIEEAGKRIHKATGPLGASFHVTMTPADIAGAAAPVAWFYLTCFLIGVIIAGGLRMLIRCPDARTWVLCGLWLTFSILGAYVYWQWPTSGTPDLEGFVMTLSTHPIHRKVALALAAGGAALFGTWALRWNSRYHTWLYAAATSVFIATILSFVALAVMIRWGGFNPLPVVSYIVLAVGQSALMWVLLLHANFIQPEPANGGRATPPGSAPARSASPQFA